MKLKPTKTKVEELKKRLCKNMNEQDEYEHQIEQAEAVFQSIEEDFEWDMDDFYAESESQ